MNVLSLFAGVGGLELGLERASMTVVGQVELDQFCRRVLAKHWPDVPRHDDVRTAADWWLSEERPPVDLICGGPPCQPVSVAGSRLGDDDDRWLWPAMADTVRALRPRYVLMENVRGLLTAGFGDILADLADLRYDVEWSLLSACAVGAPHTRERVFIVAHTQGVGLDGRRGAGPHPAPLESEGRGPQHRRTWAAESRPVGVAYGLPGRVDRLRALGNAVVPAVAEQIARLIVAAETEAAA